MFARIVFLAAALIVMGVPGPVLARNWSVGPGRDLKRPSEAAALVTDGDSVAIDPGVYEDCAVWRASHLVIAQAAPRDVVIQGPVCAGKALFVVEGHDVTIRGISFVAARAADGNGAGIRAEGVNLTIDKSRFTGNQDGILAGDNPASTILVRDSEFLDNGVCNPLCAHGIYVNHVALLRISHSRFLQQQAGHHIKSRAFRTEILGNSIRDGGAGTASYAIDIPNGGALLAKDNDIEKGPLAGNPAAVAIGEEGHLNPAGALVIAGNRFANDGATLAVFVRNRSGVPAQLSGNRARGWTRMLDGPGRVTP